MTDPMEQPLKSVTIEAQPDGTFLVGIEPPESAEGVEPTEMPEGTEGDMAEDQSEGMQPAGSIDDALDLARQMLQDDGRSPEDAMMAGYNKNKPAAKMNTAKVFGE